MATYPTSLAPDKTSVDPIGAITLTWTVDAQTHYQINYRRQGTTTWVQTGKIASATKSYTIPANTLLKNEYYEWMVRVWYGSTQYNWSARATFLAAVPASAFVKATHGVTLNALRVVPLGKSTDTSNLRIKLNSGVAEFDLVAPTHQAASPVQIATGTAGIKAIARPLSTEVYSNYGDHSNTGYIAYTNHTNQGYDRYGDYYTEGYSAYNKYVNYTAGFAEWGYDEDRHSETYNDAYSDHSKGGYNAYSNHSDTGYSKYCNHTNNGAYTDIV